MLGRRGDIRSFCESMPLPVAHKVINTHEWKIDTLINFSEIQTINEALETN